MGACTVGKTCRGEKRVDTKLAGAGQGMEIVEKGMDQGRRRLLGVLDRGIGLAYVA